MGQSENLFTCRINPFVVLIFAEEFQQVLVLPSGVPSQLRPVVEIMWAAAIGDHFVVGAAPSEHSGYLVVEHPAPRLGSVGRIVFFGIGVFKYAKECDSRDAQVGWWKVPLVDEQNGVPSLGKPSGDNGAGCPGSN